MTPEEQEAFRRLKTELKAVQRLLTAKAAQIVALEQQLADAQTAKTLASRGSLETWIRKRSKTNTPVTVYVGRARPDDDVIGISISHEGAEIHGHGHTLDEAFDAGLKAALEGIEKTAELEREKYR